MRVLVLSNVPWSGENGTGNTFTNLFSDLPDIEIANIYTRYGMPDDLGLVSRFYQITDNDMLHGTPGRSFLNGHLPEPEKIQTQVSEKGRYDFFRKHRFMFFFWGRELIWKLGKWNTPELRAFVDDFRPDLIYLPIYDCTYLSDIGMFLKRHTGVKMIGCIWDDIYSLKQFRLSPFFWIDRFWKRGKIRKVVKQCDFLHVISEKQKREYEKVLKKECRLIRKSMEFGGDRCAHHEIHEPIRYVYTGNLGSHRWKVLVSLGQVLQKNSAILYIYSSTPLNAAMKKAFGKCSSLKMMGAVSAKECAEIQNDADVLVLVESIRLRDYLTTRLSISTKVVEYLHTGNCILAIGPSNQAGMEYLRNGNAAVCVDDISKLAETVKQMDKNVICDYGERAWQFGKRNHSKKKVKEIFYSDLKG